MDNKILNLIPYLHFEGKCEEALGLYGKILNGKVNIKERYDNPAMKAPQDYQNKVLHATLEFGEHVIMASDVFPGHSAQKGTGDAFLSITVADPEEGDKIFKQLAEGGKVNVPYEKQFWGAWHGNLKDQYGNGWMVNCE